MIPIAAQSWQTKSGPAVPLTVAAMLAAAILIQSIAIPVDADVSWLITVCERVLGGERLYVDIIEANPPASVWLYMPAVWLAQQLGWRPEALVIGFAMASALLSIRWTVGLTARLQRPPAPLWLAAGAGFVTLILPGGLFAQREHFAFMLALPAVATMVLLGERVNLGRAASLGAGIAAGLVIVIKPHFALAILLPAIWSAAMARDWRPFRPSLIAASLVVMAYAIAVLLFASDYFALLPMLQATYLPMRDRPLNFLLGPMLVVPAALYVLGQMLRVRRTPPLSTALFLASAGFALAGLIQGKNYLNHAYPGVALAFLALWLLFGERPENSAGRKFVAAVGALLVGFQLYATASIQPPAGLADAIRNSAPSPATVMTLSTELGTGHPAVRHADARWVGSRPSLFTAAGARFAGLGNAEMRRWYREDLDSVVHDIGRARPELLLLDDGSKRWLLADPAIRSALQDYAPVARAGSVEVWRRR